MADEWWKGRALDQDTHARINATHYPGTLQICCDCDSPTGRAGPEDEMRVDGYGPLCEDCYEAQRVNVEREQ